jgi:hypothetical protein
MLSNEEIPAEGQGVVADPREGSVREEPVQEESAQEAVSSGPVLQLLAAGLQLWIRSQCQSVGSLELRLHGTGLQLLRGRLAGVTLQAREVIYEDLEIEQVELRSEPLRIQLGNVLRGQPVVLEHPFQIQGRVAFTAEGLTRSLASFRWQPLADALAEQLLGIVPLEELRIPADTLVLAVHAIGEDGPIELETRPVAVDGGVEIRALAGDPFLRLPMDPNIRITSAVLEAGRLHLRGEARVSP